MEGIVPHANALRLTAALAAYRDSEDRRRSFIGYLRDNRDGLDGFVVRAMGLNMEATYRAWIDCCSLPADNPAIFFAEAGVGLSDGKVSGPRGL